MDHNLEDSLTLDGVMDFDHSEDVVNQEDIPLEDSGSLNITMDMDDVGDQPHTIMETVNDEVIVSDLIEDPFPFQEYTVQSDGASSSNIMVDQNQLNQLTVQHELATPSLQTLLKAPQAATNPVTQKVQTRPTKRMVASAPPRQVAIAPKPVPTKAVHYAIAPKPVALIANKHNVGSIKKIPITSDGKGNTVLAQLGRQLVMVPKKIKLMSSTSGEGVIKTSSSGLQYQVACSKDQAQLLSNTNKGPKPMLKFIQLQGQSGAEQSSTSGVLTKMLPASGPQARYVMQQKTVPISIGGNKVVQNFKIAGKKQIIAIKSQSPKVVQVSQGNVTTKQVVISSNSNQKVLIRTTAPTSTTQVIKDTGSMGQRTQYHPINVPGKGIQYIKLVTNQPAQKPAAKQMAVPSTNFVFTDSKGNVIQMTAEKVAGAQPPSIAHPTAVSGNKGVVKALKSQKKLVRIAPVSKAASQSITHPSRSTHSLLTPMTTAPSAAPMTSLPAISTPSASPAVAEPAVTLEFNEMVEHSDGTIQPAYNQTNNENANRVSYNLSNYDPNDFSIAEIDYSTTEQYSAEDTSQPLEETVGGSTDPDETIEEKPPTLQSLISEVVSEEISRKDGTNRTYEVGIEYGNKRDTIRNASFTLRAESSMGHDASDTSALNNEDSIIIVPGTNYTERQNESFYSEESQAYRSQRLSLEDRKEVPLLSVEAECHPYPEHIQPESPLALDSEEVSGLDMRPRKACNCTKSQCLKLYCDCFANGEFCNNCNCNNCCNNLENEEIRQKSIRSCLERNPNAFRPKIGKSKTGGPELIRRHTKGCNCKRSGCLKNYCECYEAKIACTAMCKCVGCRNVEETLVRRRDAMRLREKLNDTSYRPAPAAAGPVKQPCSFMTTEVIEAVCQCLIAAAGESDAQRDDADPVQDVIEEFARCLQDVITASHHTL